MQKPSLKAVALTPDFPEIKLTADEVITNINCLMTRIASGKDYKTMSVWRFQKLVFLGLPDPATVSALTARSTLAIGCRSTPMLEFTGREGNRSDICGEKLTRGS